MSLTETGFIDTAPAFIQRGPRDVWAQPHRKDRQPKSLPSGQTPVGVIQPVIVFHQRETTTNTRGGKGSREARGPGIHGWSRGKMVHEKGGYLSEGWGGKSVATKDYEQ